MTLAEKWVEEGMEKGLVKGREEGIKRGWEEGARKVEIEMAKRAIHEGMGFGLISKLTGLPEAKITQMAEEVVMPSSLRKELYEKGLAEGKSITLIRLLTRRFGILPVGLKGEIEKAAPVKIDLLIDKLWDYKSLEQVKASLS